MIKTYEDNEFSAKPFAFAAKAPAAAPYIAPTSSPAPAAPQPTKAMLEGKEYSPTPFLGMEPIYEGGNTGPVRDRGAFLGYGFKYSQLPGYGMVPVYERQGGRAGERGEPAFLGYEFNPIAAGLGKVEATKPAGVLAEEKRLGTTMEPIYQTYTTPRGGRDGDNPESIQYGPPIGYRYDNGKSQYVNFDAGGQYVQTQDRKKGGLGDILPFLAILALPFVGPALLPSVFGAGAAGAAGATLGALEGALTAAEIAALPGAATLAEAATGAGLLADTAALGAGQVAAAAPLAFTPEMIAAGAFTPGSIGAAGAAQGLLSIPELAAAYGAGGGLLSDLAPLTAAPQTVAQTIPEVAAQTIPEVAAQTIPQVATPSINEMVASGTFTPGSAGAVGAASGALTGAELAAAGGLLTQGATPALVDMAAQGAQDYIDSGGSQLSGTSGPNGTDIFRETSINQGVASGLSPGSMGAEMAATGGLTAEQLAAAAGTTGAGSSFSLPSLSTVKDALTVASLVAGAAGNKDTSTAAPFTMAPYVPPSGKPFANLGMSPIATPYTPTRILGQYDPTMTPGGVSPYELIMQQMQAPKNLYADFEAGTNIGGFDPQRFVVSPAAAATALPNNMGGMINKSRMVGPNPMGPDNGFASIQDGEFVMNRKATQKYGIELMNAINSGKISKGKLFGLLEA